MAPISGNLLPRNEDSASPAAICMTIKNERFARVRILVIGFLGAVVLRLVNLTLRWKRIGLSEDERWWADGKPCILVFWHGRQLFMPWIYLNHRRSRRAPAMAALISQHSDGRMIAAGMRFLGIDSVAGSSSRGGLKALHLLIQKLRNHSHVAITPDGPKGPRHKLKNGALIVAQRSGATIYPTAFAAEKFWRFSSWDEMIFPKPFSRAVLIKGAPISVDRDCTAEQLEFVSSRVETALNDVTRRADEYFQRAVA